MRKLPATPSNIVWCFLITGEYHVSITSFEQLIDKLIEFSAELSKDISPEAPTDDFLPLIVDRLVDQYLAHLPTISPENYLLIFKQINLLAPNIKDLGERALIRTQMHSALTYALKDAYQRQTQQIREGLQSSATNFKQDYSSLLNLGERLGLQLRSPEDSENLQQYTLVAQHNQQELSKIQQSLEEANKKLRLHTIVLGLKIKSNEAAEEEIGKKFKALRKSIRDTEENVKALRRKSFFEKAATPKTLFQRFIYFFLPQAFIHKAQEQVKENKVKIERCDAALETLRKEDLKLIEEGREVIAVTDALKEELTMTTSAASITKQHAETLDTMVEQHSKFMRAYQISQAPESKGESNLKHGENAAAFLSSTSVAITKPIAIPQNKIREPQPHAPQSSPSVNRSIR